MKNPISKTKAWSMIGLAIHTMDPEHPAQVDHQGHVVQQHGDRILLEWFEWLMGEGTFATWHTLDEAAALKWRFFETVADMNSYYEANKYVLTGGNP
jgi:hypothetical protein